VTISSQPLGDKCFYLGGVLAVDDPPRLRQLKRLIAGPPALEGHPRPGDFVQRLDCTLRHGDEEIGNERHVVLWASGAERVQYLERRRPLGRVERWGGRHGEDAGVVNDDAIVRVSNRECLDLADDRAFQRAYPAPAPLSRGVVV